ncbi:MAG: hypothetical protein ACRDK3_06050 [Actinomycetota bacterium]
MTLGLAVLDTGVLIGALDALGILRNMTLSGNLTCDGCGLTFTARWGSLPGADEYRCARDHVLLVEAASGGVLTVEGTPTGGYTLAELRGVCPLCATELLAGRLPACPVCGGRDHEVLLSGPGEGSFSTLSVGVLKTGASRYHEVHE